MSLIIFFGYSLFIFLLGVTVITVTFHHWYKLAKAARAEKKLAESTH